MVDPAEHALVIKALKSGLSNCAIWASDKDTQRIRNSPDMLGWTPSEIRRRVISYVEAGGLVTQVLEVREGHRDHYDFWYKVILPLPDFPRGLFVELRLADDDPDVPCVEFVNAHPQLS